jgi:hypothetical protein
MRGSDFDAVADFCEETSEATKTVRVFWADKVHSETVNWLWPNRVPLGMLTMFAGVPDVGKSTVTRDLVARITTARDFPDGVNSLPACSALMLISEESIKQTVVPSLKAAGADLARVCFVEQTELTTDAGKEERDFALTTDINALEDLLARNPEIRLVVIDPIGGYLGGLKRNSDDDIRPLLKRLFSMAENFNVAVIMLNHLNKSQEKSFIDRVAGAGAFVQIPRASWFFLRDDEDETKEGRLMLCQKCNLISEDKKKGLKFTVESANVTLDDGNERDFGFVVWGETSDRCLADVMTKPDPTDDTALMSKVCEWLLAGPAKEGILAAEGYEQLENELGASAKTVQRAIRLLKKQKKLDVYQSNKRWWWGPPESSSETSASCDDSEQNTF